jgi:hypothetical protein
MNKIIQIDEIRNKIYTIREKQVMLDRDLAELYGVKSIRLREQVKRNIERFPDDFMFQLRKQETELMVSQNAIPSVKYLGGFLPYVFTEQGISMLSSVIRSKKAIEININIMRSFIEMRKQLIQNASFFNRVDNIENKLIEHDNKIEIILNEMDKCKLPKQGLFFKGQVYDAHIFVSNLIKKAQNKIILIDNYINSDVITLFTDKKQDVKVKIYTREISDRLILEKDKFNEQYFGLDIIHFNHAHDRFLIIDNETYHIGASLKYLGKKLFAFSKMEDNKLHEFLLSYE